MRATILIPAHNEASVIGRTLMHIVQSPTSNDFRIVVVANACTDATASRVRSILPTAHVLETEAAGKCHALNLGYMLAERERPVICLDADLDVTIESLVALVDALEDGSKQAACGQMDVCVSGASSLVRSYYKGWRTNPYFDRGKFGGVFAICPETAARLFPLPLITADDEYVRRVVGEDKIAFVPECRFKARAPKVLSSLVEVRRRSLRGAREVSSMGLQSPERGSTGKMIGRLLRNPSLLWAGFVYVCVNTWARVLPRKNGVAAAHWERDMTSRLAE